MILFSLAKASDGEPAGRFLSHLPGAEGTRDLYDFCQAVGADWKEVKDLRGPDESIELRTRKLKRAEKEAGARLMAETDIAEVLLYKRYLHAASDEDRVERRLVGRMVIALVEFGYDVGAAAEAAAASFGLGAESAAGEINLAAMSFTGGYATWKDDPGTAEKCSRCRREFIETLADVCECGDIMGTHDMERQGGHWCSACHCSDFKPAVRGQLEADVDNFFRCPDCRAAVRGERSVNDLVAGLANGAFREVM